MHVNVVLYPTPKSSGIDSNSPIKFYDIIAFIDKNDIKPFSGIDSMRAMIEAPGALSFFASFS